MEFLFFMQQHSGSRHACGRRRSASDRTSGKLHGRVPALLTWAKMPKCYNLQAKQRLALKANQWTTLRLLSVSLLVCALLAQHSTTYRDPMSKKAVHNDCGDPMHLEEIRNKTTQ
eukprot:2202290-Amphidinium_carterae.1